MDSSLFSFEAISYWTCTVGHRYLMILIYHKISEMFASLIEKPNMASFRMAVPRQAPISCDRMQEKAKRKLSRTIEKDWIPFLLGMNLCMSTAKVIAGLKWPPLLSCPNIKLVTPAEHATISPSLRMLSFIEIALNANIMKAVPIIS